MNAAGQLYIVATPIGHLGDVSVRALAILKQVSWIAAEDTRHSKILLNHYAINTPLISLHNYNENERVQQLLQRLQRGESGALISDAGTPLISDPGFVLVQALHQQGIRVTPIPGACAAITALCASGLSTQEFLFAGFLPAKGARRTQRLQSLLQEPRTVIVYESPRRALDLLSWLAQNLPSARKMVVARELTKQFESILCDSAPVLYDWYRNHEEALCGEWVVLWEGAEPVTDEGEQAQIAAAQHILKILLGDLGKLSVKQAVTLAVELTALPRNQLYTLALHLKQEMG